MLFRSAFEGRLAAQDPNDEPASVLLARIKAEKTEQEKNTRAKNQKKNAARFSIGAGRKAVKQVSSPL